MDSWTEESKQEKAISGKGPLAREVILGLLPLIIAIAVMVAIIAGLIDLLSVAMLDVGNRTLAQTKLVTKEELYLY
jgi:hypothetical protein